MDVPYTALARRFRPQTFSEVVGQGRIATTLRNAILDGRVAHAYLFTGARGVGKTSMARIFAKALNCPTAVDAVPCGECEICRAIAAGQDVDVSEIDGASNRGIDDIRQLRANVNVRSMRSKFKVYIVDEVHMLTKEAFNALLKTLEEPPPGVKFIFCTTEPNRVPDTILSRCQRFDFGTIATQEIMGRLAELATAEGFDVEPAALELVARRAAGSMRDSQSLFDQLLAFGSEKITAEDVHRLLGTAPDERLVGLVQALLDRQPDRALGLLDDALADGVQLEPLWDQTMAYFRDLMVTATGATTLALLSVGDDQRPRLQEQARGWGLRTILAGLEILSETRQRMQKTTFGRALAELGLVRLALLRDLDRLEELIAEFRKHPGQPMPATARSIPAASLAPPEPPRLSASSGAVPPTATQKKSDGLSAQLPDSLGVTTGDGDSVPRETLAGGEGATGSAPPAVVWSPTCGPQLLTALQAEFADLVGTYLKQITSIAIIGPNQLEFSFPIRYDFGRRACERPEVLSRIESAILKLTGQSVRVKFCTTDVGASAPAPVPKGPAGPPRLKTVETPDDSLVAFVGQVFGVEAWTQQHLGTVAAVGDADEERVVDSGDTEGLTPDV